MRGSERRTGNEAPLLTHDRRWNVSPRGQQNISGHIVPVIPRDRKHSPVRSRKAAIADLRIRGADNGDTARQGSVEKPLEQPIAWPAEAQVDHLGIFVERELQRLRQGEAAAIGCRVAGLRRLPASAQSQEFRLGGDAGNTYAVIGTRGDDACDRGPVRFGDIAATIDKVSRHGHPSVQIRMVHVNAGVDLGHPNASSRRDLVQLVQMPALGAWLQRIQRIVVRQHAEQMHRLRRFDARIQR